MAEPNQPNVWDRINIALSSVCETKSDDYWKNVFTAAKARTVLKAQLLQTLQSNNIEIADDFQMTEIEHRIFQMEKSTETYDEHKIREDQCRVCLAVVGIGFVNLFKNSHETPSIIDKLMECSRISQVTSCFFFLIELFGYL